MTYILKYDNIKGQGLFSDVQYYKAMCLSKMEKREEAKELMAIAEKNGKDGFSLNEDNAFYERYPYQVRWR